jgi:hypothetical protein
MTEEPSKSQTWWQTLPGILTAVAATITALTGLIVALHQSGLFSWMQKPVTSNPTTNSPTNSPSSPSSLTIKPSPSISASSLEVNISSMNDLEKKLKGANIVLSTGSSEDVERVRGYFTGSKSAYYLLTASCLQIVDNQRLKKIGYLDMIDKWYTLLVGEKNYISADGKLNLEKVKEAMVKAQNEYYGDGATSFEQIIESR